MKRAKPNRAKSKKAKQRARSKRPTTAQLEALVEEATVDAYDESEQAAGFFTMFEEHLKLPFDTRVLGVDVVVENIGLSEREDVVVVCRHGKERQTLPILDLPLPTLPPTGWEWIEAYRHWARGRR